MTTWRTLGTSKRLIFLAAVILLSSTVTSCVRLLRAPPPSANYYESPIGNRLSDRKRTLGPSNLFSNLGEYRGTSGDAPNWFNHGATDFVGPRNTRVFSPDTGEVKFYGGGAINSGLPPVKIGHFAFLHFRNTTRLPMDPKTLGDNTARTFVVNPGDPIWVPRRNRPPKQTTLSRRRQFRVGVREEPPGSGNWNKVFWYNRRAIIGETTGPDLHVIYYDDPGAPYDARASIRNALTVFKYENAAPPLFGKFRLFSQEPTNPAGNKAFIADNDSNRLDRPMSIPDHKGVDVVIAVSSFARSQTNLAGIHKLAYAIYKILQRNEPFTGTVITGAGNRRLGEIDAEQVMYTYTNVPPRAQDENLVAYPNKHVPPDGPASLYANVDQPKHTSYVVTNIDGDDAMHWALEDTTKYPDGEYVVRIKAWNIAKSNGIGNAPDLNEAILDVIVSIETIVARQVRLLTVRNP